MAKGDSETMIGGMDPEFSRIIAKRMRGEKLTEQEKASIGEPVSVIPRPRPQRVNSAKKANPLMPVVKKANGGMVRGDGVARVKTKGQMC